MDGKSARYSGWRNWETWQLVMALDDDDGWVLDILDGFREDGIPASDQTYMLAEAIEQRLSDEWQELGKKGKLLYAVIPDPSGPALDIDYMGIADRYVSLNEDTHSDMDAIASRSRKRPAQSAARKKAPAKRKTTTKAKPKASNNARSKTKASTKKPVKRTAARRYRDGREHRVLPEPLRDRPHVHHE